MPSCIQNNTDSSSSVFAVWGQLFQQGKHNRCILIHSEYTEDVWSEDQWGNNNYHYYFMCLAQPRARHADSKEVVGISSQKVSMQGFISWSKKQNNRKRCRVCTSNHGQIPHPFKPAVVQTSPGVCTEQNITAPSALFSPSVFFQTDCLSALCSNLKSVWRSWRRALFLPALCC